MNEMIAKIPLGYWIEEAVFWLEIHLEGLFNAINTFIEWIVDGLMFLLMLAPFWVLILLVGLITWRLISRRSAIGFMLSLLLVWNLGYWEDTLITFALVFTSALIALVFGIPLGIYCAQSDGAERAIKPILDFMQTMPAFVYLIPAVFFFGTGSVPGVLASVIFAMPPTIRMTNLGIRQVPKEMVEAADAFGATRRQKLFGVQLPLAKPTIMAGVNQSIMLSLSMVVIGAMIGAKGLGAVIYRSVTQIRIGEGFEAGIAVVIVAIVLDRLTQSLSKEKKKKKGFGFSFGKLSHQEEKEKELTS